MLETSVKVTLARLCRERLGLRAELGGETFYSSASASAPGSAPASTSTSTSPPTTLKQVSMSKFTLTQANTPRKGCDRHAGHMLMLDSTG